MELRSPGLSCTYLYLSHHLASLEKLMVFRWQAFALKHIDNVPNIFLLIATHSHEYASEKANLSVVEFCDI